MKASVPHLIVRSHICSVPLQISPDHLTIIRNIISTNHCFMGLNLLLLCPITFVELYKENDNDLIRII